jgi:hypothetical protein
MPCMHEGSCWANFSLRFHTGPKKMNICRQFKALSSPLLEQFCELRHCTTIDSWPMPSYAAPGSLLDSQCRVDAVLLGYGVHSNLCLLCIDNKIRVGCSTSESRSFLSLEVKMIQQVGKALLLPALSSLHIYNY